MDSKTVKRTKKESHSIMFEARTTICIYSINLPLLLKINGINVKTYIYVIAGKYTE